MACAVGVVAAAFFLFWFECHAQTMYIILQRIWIYDVWMRALKHL